MCLSFGIFSFLKSPVFCRFAACCWCEKFPLSIRAGIRTRFTLASRRLSCIFSYMGSFFSLAHTGFTHIPCTGKNTQSPTYFCWLHTGFIWYITYVRPIPTELFCCMVSGLPHRGAKASVLLLLPLCTAVCALTDTPRSSKTTVSDTTTDGLVSSHKDHSSMSKFLLAFLGCVIYGTRGQQAHMYFPYSN